MATPNTPNGTTLPTSFAIALANARDEQRAQVAREHRRAIPFIFRV